MEVDLDKGIQIIGDTIALLEDKKDFPYFFVVGAGISVPEIPTASKITEMCKKLVEKRNSVAFQNELKTEKELSLDASSAYSFWIEKAFPNPINRSSFYKSLIKNAKISSANLMLAQILHSKIVTNTVFTTNFDDKVEQALDIIGTKDVFCSENKGDNLVVNVNSDEIQIVHVHGTYRFYDIANLASEISEVSGQNEMVSSAQLLRNFLQQKAPIVIGYSGWENDVIMKKIKERLTYPVPYNFIWVCFSKDDYVALPTWLKESRSVYFVLPSEVANQCDESIETVYKNYKEVSEHQIPATLFLGKLIAQLKITPPEIFVNPYEHFATMVEDTLPGNEDVLHLKHWAQRMKYRAYHETKAEEKIRNLEIALVGKDFEKVCDVLLEFSNMDLDEQDVQFLSKCISCELLEDKRLIRTTSCKMKLLFAALSFAEKNSVYLDQINEISVLLYEIISVSVGRSERSDYCEILNRVKNLTDNAHSDDLLDVNLAAIGITSQMTKNKDEKLKWLNLLLEKVPKETTNKHLRYKEMVTLLYKCRLVEEEESLSLLAAAEKICKDNSLKGAEILLLETKAELSQKISNDTQSISWAEECLNNVITNISKNSKIETLKVVLAISKIPSSRLAKISDVDKKISGILDTIDNGRTEKNCATTLLIVEIYRYLMTIPKSPITKLHYCEAILSMSDKLQQECKLHLNEKIQYECKSYKWACLLTYKTICELPISVVPDELKISYLNVMKNMVGDNQTAVWLYSQALENAANLGNQQLYSANFELDYENITKNNELREKMDQAIDMYLHKDYINAERAFQELSRSDNIMQDNALNNMALMARRGELTEGSPNFIELISKVSDSNIFKHMNLLLYYLQTEVFDMDQCRKAYKTLKNLDPNKIKQLQNWWQREDIVGKEECAIGMLIINSLTGGKISISEDMKAGMQYNWGAIENVINPSILQEGA